MNKSINILDFGLDILRSIWVSIVTALVSFYQPIHDFLGIIAVLFILNFICGWAADMFEKNEWSFKKAITSIWHLSSYFLLLFLSFGVGLKMKLEEESVIAFTAWITWVVIYFYTTNILRNLKLVQPKNQVIKFLYWFLSVQFLKQIRYLPDYFNSLNNKDDEQEKP